MVMRGGQWCNMIGLVAALIHQSNKRTAYYTLYTFLPATLYTTPILTIASPPHTKLLLFLFVC